MIFVRLIVVPLYPISPIKIMFTYSTCLNCKNYKKIDNKQTCDKFYLLPINHCDGKDFIAK